MDKAGTDATKEFNFTGHSMNAIEKRDKMCIGNTLVPKSSSSNLVYIVIGVIVLLVGGWALMTGQLGTN